MISLKQINNKVVKAIPIPADLDKRPIKGYDICNELYANIFLTAKKKSGKTSALFKIMKDCSVKDTHIIVFCSTIFKDENWIEIRKYFEKKGNDIQVFTSIYEDGEDQLAKLIDQLSKEAEEKDNDEKELDEPLPEIDICDDILNRLTNASSPANPNGYTLPKDIEPEEEKKKKRKSKYRAPEYMIIFDDLSSELKSRSLLDLLKKNRHYKSKLIISSQWLHDLLPESRKQLDVFLIFKGFPIKKMQEIYKDCDSSLPFDIFYKIYRKSTKLPHSFMYIDTRSDKFRCNFDQEYIITSPEDDE